MKRIYIVRHAKSSWADLTLSDKDRPLNVRGNRDAPIMAQKIKAITPEIDELYASTSQRTRETSDHFKMHVSFAKVTYLDRIYHAPYQDLLEVIQDISEEITTAMLIGHNPGSTDLYNHFASEYLDNLPTCGIFVLEIDGQWIDTDQQNTVARGLIYPKMFI